MTEMANKVSNFASHCHPDKLYDRQDVGDINFIEINLEDILHDPNAIPEVGVLIVRDGEGVKHLLNSWSRSQLLSIVGTKEKWFNTVTRSQEAEELNLRRSTLYSHRFRTMDSSIPGLRILRGIVSNVYGDIPDSDIMEVMLELMPDGYAVKNLSDKTDKALYVHAIQGTPIGIPGTKFFGLPGVVVKNSEVGYTSLWVIPTLYLPQFKQHLIFEKQVLLRRTHRGSISEMKEKFEEAMVKAAVVWTEAGDRVSALMNIKYANADLAVSEMKNLLIQAGGSKMMAFRAEQTYIALGNTTHSGHTIFTAIMGVVEKVDADVGYTDAAIAGAVLWKLTNQP